MYKLLLIFRYLRRKLAPLFAALAVTLCTAMVIIVISVMGGFLQLMRNSVRTLAGDVMVRADLNGFPYYDELIDNLKKHPEIAAATPLVQSFGLINLDSGKVKAVEYHGIDPAGFNQVTQFRSRLHWKSNDAIEYYSTIRDYFETPTTNPATGVPLAPRPNPVDELIKFLKSPATHSTQPTTATNPDGTIVDDAPDKLRDIAMSMQPPKQWGDFPGCVPGIHVSPRTRRDKNGNYDYANSSVGQKVTITVLRLSKAGQPVEPSVQQMIVLDEFKSGLFDIDANRVYVPFPILQKMLGMDPHEIVNPDTGDPTGKTAPGRTTEVMVRGTAGVPLERIQKIVQAEVDVMLSKHDDILFLSVITWEDLHRRYLEAVEKEKGMLVFLFGFISLVAVAMIGVIFYMIVLEKTRDIGVLRAIGASRWGIVSIFLGYGLAIGIVGSIMGLGLASEIVWHLNDIQDFLGRHLGEATYYVGVAATFVIVGGSLGMVVGWFLDAMGRSAIIGGCVAGLISPLPAFFYLGRDTVLHEWLNSHIRFMMWDPSIYYFDRIPGQLNPTEVTVIMIVAVVSSVIGSLVPAYLAGRVDPVESLRYE